MRVRFRTESTVAVSQETSDIARQTNIVACQGSQQDPVFLVYRQHLKQVLVVSAGLLIVFSRAFPVGGSVELWRGIITDLADDQQPWALI